MQLSDLCFSRNDSVKKVNSFLFENFKFSIDESASVESLISLRADIKRALDEMHLMCDSPLEKNSDYAKYVSSLHLVESLLNGKETLREAHGCNDRVCTLHASAIYPIVVHCHDVNGLELESAIDMAILHYRTTPDTGISDADMQRKLQRMFCDEHPGEYPDIELELEEGDSKVTREFNKLPDIANIHGDDIPTVYPVDDTDVDHAPVVKEPPLLTKPMPSRKAVFNVDDGFTSFDANRKATVMPSIKPRTANRQKVFSSIEEPVTLYMNEGRKVKFDKKLNEGILDLIAREQGSDNRHTVRVKFMEDKNGAIIVKRVFDVSGCKYDVNNLNVLAETISKQIKKGK